MWSKAWTAGERDNPPVHKEAQAWAQGMGWVLPYVRAHGQHLYTYTDSLPVSWMQRAQGKKALAQYKLGRFDDVEWSVRYLQGPRNREADALSRPPFLGPLQPTIQGIVNMIKTWVCMA